MSRPLPFPQVKPVIVKCDSFQTERENSTVTAVIVPVAFTHPDYATWTIGWACNHGRICSSETCIYAKNKHKPKISIGSARNEP